MEIAKQGAQSLRKKMRNIELYLNGATKDFSRLPVNNGAELVRVDKNTANMWICSPNLAPVELLERTEAKCGKGLFFACTVKQ